MSERPSYTPPEAEEEAKDFKIYDRPDEKIGCDKGSHKLRSEANDKRKRGHKEHFKKEKQDE